MPRPILTPEERQARQAANWQRWYARNKDKQRARERERYHANRAVMTPEEVDAFNARHAESAQRFREGHRQEVNAKARAHYHKPEIKARENARDKTQREADPAFWLAYGRAARQRNHATHVAASQRWHAEHPHAAALAVNKRRARLKNAARNDVTPEQRQLVIDTAHGICAYCQHYNPTCQLCEQGAHKQLTVDHILAIAEGGDNTLHNLVACCRSCNAKKRTSKNPIPVQPLLLRNSRWRPRT